MSTEVYPTLAGLQFGIERSPEFNTIKAQAASGKEQRLARWAYPKWHYDLAYEFLRDDTTNNELKQLAGFFLKRQGAADNFNFLDPDDYQVADQNFGTGTGSATAFQLARDYGGFREPVYRPRSDTNQISHPEQFDNPVWIGFGAGPLTTVQQYVNTPYPPDKGITQLIECVGGGASYFRITQPVSYTTAVYCFSVYVKRGSGIRDIALQQTAGSIDYLLANFNLSTGLPGYLEVSGIASNGKSGIEILSDGWFRVWVSGIASPGQPTLYPYIYLVKPAETKSYVGEGYSLYVWGAKFELGATPTPYISAPKVYRTDWQGTRRLHSSARTNKLLRSQEFGTSPWIDFNTPVVTPNSDTAPDGTVTADTITDNSATLYEGRGQYVAVPNDFDTWYFSIFVKKTTGGTSTTFGINMSLLNGASTATYPRINTDTGAIISPADAGVAWVESVSATWWRVVCAVANNGSGNNSLEIFLFPAIDSYGGLGNITVQGSAVVWGAEVFNWGGTNTSYIPTTSAEVTVTDYSVTAEGVVSLAAAPLSGAALTWWGSFYKRVRFKTDLGEFNKFMKNLWEAKKVNLVTDK